jgi:hypothetical protein
VELPRPSTTGLKPQNARASLDSFQGSSTRIFRGTHHRIENYTKDGVAYKIEVQQDGGDFMAVWTCGKCGDVGQTSSGYTGAKGATAAAKALLFSNHHVGAHVAT